MKIYGISFSYCSSYFEDAMAFLAPTMFENFPKNHMFWQTSLRAAIQMYPNIVNLQVYYKCAQAAISTDGNWQETARDAPFAYFPYFWNYIFAYLPYFWICIFTIFSTGYCRLLYLPIQFSGDISVECHRRDCHIELISFFTNLID